ncbi:MAG: hypothetical protein FJ221_09440 [Lentisphaerae bacterium]|nr:hypothetical protein [Lentisphaerota bacterium]
MVIRILIEILTLAAGSIIGAGACLAIRGPVMGIDENILFRYIMPGAAGGLFLAVTAILYFRKLLSFATGCRLLLGSAAGIGASALFWYRVWEFEPPGNDTLFMLLYFTLFALGGMALGLFLSRKVLHRLQNRQVPHAGKESDQRS